MCFFLQFLPLIFRENVHFSLSLLLRMTKLIYTTKHTGNKHGLICTFVPFLAVCSLVPCEFLKTQLEAELEACGVSSLLARASTGFKMDQIWPEFSLHIHYKDEKQHLSRTMNQIYEQYIKILAKCMLLLIRLWLSFVESALLALNMRDKSIKYNESHNSLGNNTASVFVGGASHTHSSEILFIFIWTQVTVSFT